MFTGIVEEMGTVRALDRGRLVVACRKVLEDTAVGSSIAVDGVCLTVVERTDRALAFDVSDETARRTNLLALGPGDPVNLERPVTLMTRLGGHLVQGHVDGVGEVREIDRGETGATMTVVTGEDLIRYVAPKGSVAVDGVSLTVVSVAGRAFSVALVPHTLAATTLGRVARKHVVNIEVDVIAKYVERLVGGGG